VQPLIVLKHLLSSDCILFLSLVGFVGTENLKGCIGGAVATGRISLAGQTERYEEECHVPPGWGLCG
jgi:hypothetical protein